MNLIQRQPLFISTKLISSLHQSLSIYFSRPLAFDYGSARRSDLNGQLSRAVTTVLPQNPFNQMDIKSTTTNASLDSRPHVLLQTLPRSTATPSKERKDDQQENNQKNQLDNHFFSFSLNTYQSTFFFLCLFFY